MIIADNCGNQTLIKSREKLRSAFNVIVTIMDMIEHMMQSHTIVEKKNYQPHSVIK